MRNINIVKVEPILQEVIPIQYLRGIAAVAVVIHHLSWQVRVAPFVTLATSAFASGVDLFFVISGFVMAWTALNSNRLSARAFFARRLMRIVPLYWLVTSLMLLVLIATPELMRTAKLDWPHAIGSFLFVPVINPATGFFEPLAIPGWTLNYEMAFYLVFAVAIGAAGGEARRTLLIAGGGLVAIVAAGRVLPAGGVISFYTNPIILEFVFGMAVAAIVKNPNRVSPAVLMVIAVAAGLLLFWPSGTDIERAVRRGIPAAVVIIAAAWLVVPKLRTLRILGDASYSIYLSHIVTVAVVMKLAAALHLLEQPEWRALTLLGGSIACVLVGVMVWYTAERPLTRAVRESFGERFARPGHDIEANSTALTGRR